VSHRGVLKTGQMQIVYYMDGPTRAPVLLLSNSLGTTSAMWDPQVSRLSSHFLVLRYDQRGHGASGSPKGPYAIEDLGHDALDLLDMLGVERAAICGLSLGGMVAIWMAANAPDRVTHLILASTSAKLGPPEAWQERAALVRSSGTKAIADLLPERWFTTTFRNVNRKTVNDVLLMLATCDPEGYASCCEAIATMDQRGDLIRINAPTLVIAGADDPVTPPSLAFNLARMIRCASLEVLQGASHLVNLGEPERFTSAVLAHLIGDPADRGMALRREVLGNADLEHESSTFSAPFQDFLNRHTWGEVWARPGLDRRTRSAITVAMLIGLGRVDELLSHIPAAIRNGLSMDEIREVLLQSAVYCGIPAATEAFALVDKVLANSADNAAEGEVRQL